MTDTSRVFQLARRPDGAPRPDDFKLAEVPLPALGPDQVKVRNTFLSVDPYMRLPMTTLEGVHAPTDIGGEMDGGAVGEVIESTSGAMPKGSFVFSPLMGWRDLYVAGASSLVPIDPELAPLSAYLGVLGLSGMTAYAGMEYVLKPKAGETIFVSAAAGAVGMVVCQLASNHGCRVIGSTGDPRKAALLKERFGAEATINYRTEDLRASLKQFTPDGLDMYFDNVGGSHLEAALDSMKVHGRMALCGAVELYNSANYRRGPGNFFAAIEKGVTLTGFNIGLYAAQRAEMMRDLAGQLVSGALHGDETIVDGLENTGKAFVDLLAGANVGKMVVRL
ncbi:NADP-dependent oxidoreductase [Emcibacter sp. SYSU 3D8]|uniref:NADP-dependent oxidoreductase n=1 Tax=Emcibacter sp. SYSU 3D8 TaxID=3133969 RepID=UPI0031FEF4AA